MLARRSYELVTSGSGLTLRDPRCGKASIGPSLEVTPQTSAEEILGWLRRAGG